MYGCVHNNCMFLRCFNRSSFFSQISSHICLFTDQINYISQNVRSYYTIVQENDRYIIELTTKLHKKDETITVLQKQLEQSKQKRK